MIGLGGVIFSVALAIIFFAAPGAADCPACTVEELLLLVVGCGGALLAGSGIRAGDQPLRRLAVALVIGALGAAVLMAAIILH